MEVNIVLSSDVCKTRKKEFTENQQAQYSNHHHKIPYFVILLVYFTNILA